MKNMHTDDVRMATNLCRQIMKLKHWGKPTIGRHASD
jgi:hypothetical protein